MGSLSLLELRLRSVVGFERNSPRLLPGGGLALEGRLGRPVPRPDILMALPVCRLGVAPPRFPRVFPLQKPLLCLAVHLLLLAA